MREKGLGGYGPADKTLLVQVVRERTRDVIDATAPAWEDAAGARGLYSLFGRLVRGSSRASIARWA
jgi:hypothetical protein